MSITPDTLNLFTKQQIQDENIRLGGAKCARETREKTEAKFLTLFAQPKLIQFMLDDKEYSFPYPEGKTKHDFIQHILQFFTK